MVRAVQGGTGRIRTGRVGGGVISAATYLYTANFLNSGPLPAEFTLTRTNPIATCYNSSGVLTTKGSNVARFDYDPATLTALGLLIEEARTNVLVDSTTQFWGGSNATVGSAVTGIDGTSDAYPWAAAATTSPHSLSKNTFTTASPYIFSAIIKSNTLTQVGLREGSQSGSSGVFSLASGGSVTGVFSAVSYTASNAAIKSLGNSRFRPSVMISPPSSTSQQMQILLLDGGAGVGSDPGNYSFLGNGSSGLIIESCQWEVGTFPTSMIPVVNTAVTRSADALASAGSLTALLAAGPSVWELEDITTGTVTRTSFAAGAFTFPINKRYRSMAVYASGTNTTPYLTVGGTYG